MNVYKRLRKWTSLSRTLSVIYHSKLSIDPHAFTDDYQLESRITELIFGYDKPRVEWFIIREQ